MFSLSHARDKMKTSFSKNRYVIITFAPERPRMIMPRDKDCHPLQSIQLIPYYYYLINGILIVRRITSIKFLELLNKQKMLFT